MANIAKRRWDKPDGTQSTAWRVSYRDRAGKVRTKQFRKKATAESFMTTTLWEVSQGTHTADGDSISVRQAAKLWLKACQRGRDGREPVEYHTLRAYESIARIHIVPRIGDRLLNQLTKAEVSIFRNDLLDGMSRPLAKKVLAAFKSIISEAQSGGFVAQNVAEGVSITIGSRQKREIETPSKADVRHLLAVAESLTRLPVEHEAKAWRRYYPLFITLVLTGMRISELRGLSWKSIDFKNRMITVEQRADESGLIGPPKSAAGNRSIPMAPELAPILRQWRFECPIGRHNLVFPNWRGNPELLRNIHSRGWVRLQKEAGLFDREGKPKYRLHSIRHFRASVLIQSGATAKEVMSEMGHSSITMTFDTYGHLFPDDLEARHQRAAQISGDLLRDVQKQEK